MKLVYIQLVKDKGLLVEPVKDLVVFCDGILTENPSEAHLAITDCPHVALGIIGATETTIVIVSCLLEEDIRHARDLTTSASHRVKMARHLSSDETDGLLSVVINLIEGSRTLG